MPQTSHKISEASKNFAEVGPADGGKRPFGLLRQRGLPDDLFDAADSEQTAIDAGDFNDDAGIWQRKPGDRENRS